jgi:Na+-translocating ferredoxin:NAD+ oxidoreductase subunit B
MLASILLLCGLGLALGALMRWGAQRLPIEREPIVDRIDRVLPQTQCGQCGYPGCRPYAEAIARGEAGINQCPPGGAAGIAALAVLLGRDPLPLDPAHGVEKPRVLARIDEATCIGCTKCIQACPVDAIVGTAKLMHTVVAELCTGCELCLPPCPVDCIDLVPAPVESRSGRRPIQVLRPGAPVRPS